MGWYQGMWRDTKVNHSQRKLTVKKPTTLAKGKFEMDPKVAAVIDAMFKKTTWERTVEMLNKPN